MAFRLRFILTNECLKRVAFEDWKCMTKWDFLRVGHLARSFASLFYFVININFVVLGAIRI